MPNRKPGSRRPEVGRESHDRSRLHRLSARCTRRRRSRRGGSASAGEPGRDGPARPTPPAASRRSKPLANPTRRPPGLAIRTMARLAAHLVEHEPPGRTGRSPGPGASAASRAPESRWWAIQRRRPRPCRGAPRGARKPRGGWAVPARRDRRRRHRALRGRAGLLGGRKVRARNEMLACQNTLRVTHGGLAGYADTHNDRIPQIGPDATADSFAAALVSSGQVTADFRPGLPAPASRPIPSTPAPAAGYTYTLGYRRPNGELVGLRRPSTTGDEHDLLPISADYPSAGATADRRADSARMLRNERALAGGNVRVTTSPFIGPERRPHLPEYLWQCRVLARVARMSSWDGRETGHNGSEDHVGGVPAYACLRTHGSQISYSLFDARIQNPAQLFGRKDRTCSGASLSRSLDTRVRIGHITGVLRNPLPHQIGTLEPNRGTRPRVAMLRPIVKRTIRLRGISGEIKGQVWESETLLRAGRLGSLEIVLDDSSVSRRHAEVRFGDDGWYGPRSGEHQRDLRQRRADRPRRATAAAARHHPVRQGRGASSSRTTRRPKARRRTSTSSPRRRRRSRRACGGSRSIATRCRGPATAGRAPRAGHHFINMQSEDQLLDAVLNDAVSVLEAQRGAIVLAESEGPEPKFRLRALAVGHGRAPADSTSRRRSPTAASTAACRCSTAP